MSKMKKALDVVRDLRNLADSIEALAGAVGEMGTTSAPDASGPTEHQTVLPETAVQPADQPKLTIVELRAFVAGRSTPENRPKIRGILAHFGVAKLTDLPIEQYSALMQEVAAL